jgi:hypothetical protein
MRITVFALALVGVFFAHEGNHGELAAPACARYARCAPPVQLHLEVVAVALRERGPNALLLCICKHKNRNGANKSKSRTGSTDSTRHVPLKRLPATARAVSDCKFPIVAGNSTRACGMTESLNELGQLVVLDMYRQFC